jgi:hypothetical protein
MTVLGQNPLLSAQVRTEIYWHCVELQTSHIKYKCLHSL